MNLLSQVCIVCEKSTSVDINPKSYHLSAFKLINLLLYINFPSSESKVVFFKDLQATLLLYVAL